MKITRNKLVIDKDGVYIDGNLIDRCTSVDIKNISFTGDTEVVLHVIVDEVDVQHRVELRDKLRNE